MTRLRRIWTIIALPVISIVLSVIVGSLVIIFSEWLVTGELDPGLALEAYAALISGSVGSFNAIVNTLVSTVPLLLGGLSVGLAFKAGLFNIGVQGQFLMGALGAVIVGVQLREAPALIGVPVSVAAGMLAGAFWGFIPGVLKATRGAHEVVTTIMLNFIAIAFLAYMVSGPLDVPGSPSPITLDVGNAALPIILGRNGHLGLLIAPIMAILYGFLLFRTTRGFEIRIAGASPDAARYAGMSPKRLIIWTMSVAGMLGGMAGAFGAARDDPPHDRLVRDDRRLRRDRRRPARPHQPDRDRARRAALRGDAQRRGRDADPGRCPGRARRRPAGHDPLLPGGEPGHQTCLPTEEC